MRSRFVAMLVVAMLSSVPAIGQATIHLSVVDQAGHSGSLVVQPGSTFSAVVLGIGVDAEPASGVQANLDSFTYRMIFSVSGFVLLADSFAVPFDSNRAPTGFNGSVPWPPPPTPITNSADAGSPGATAQVADLYRTTATRFGDAATSAEFLLETLSLKAPSTNGAYVISLQVLEAADSSGAFHTVSTNAGLSVQVVPEPSTFHLLACGLGMLLLAWLGARRAR